MTDPIMPVPAAPARPVPATVPKASRGMKIVLAVSLAVNLAVAGVVVGRALEGGGHGPRGMARDLAFGPYNEALDSDDRRVLARQMIGMAPDMRDMRRLMQADLDQVVAALLADPFDPAALDAALSAQSRRVSETLDLAQSALRDLLVAMEPDKRAAFAKRLQERKGGPGRD